MSIALPHKNPCPKCGVPTDADIEGPTVVCEHCSHEFEPKTNHAERPHAKRSSSQLNSLAGCRGFRPFPTKKVHWVTAQGTRGHEALDSGDDEKLESSFEERMVKLCRKYCDDLPLHTRQFEEQCVKTLEGRWGYTDRLRIRAKVTLDSEFRTRIDDSDEADLIDYKFVRAKHVIDAEHNLQGKDYVVAIFEDPQFSFLNKIHTHFIEPRFESVTTHTFTREDIPSLKLEIFAVLAQARETDGTQFKGEDLNPSYENCRYCGMAGNCVALRRITHETLRRFDPAYAEKHLTVPEETHASRVSTPEGRAQLAEMAALAEVFCKSTRAHLLQAALDSDDNLPAGYVLDWPKGRRYVTDRDALITVAREFGISPEDIIDSSNIGWGRLEERVRGAQPRGRKKDAIERFEARLLEAGAVERGEPSPTLKRAHTD